MTSQVESTNGPNDITILKSSAGFDKVTPEVQIVSYSIPKEQPLPKITKEYQRNANSVLPVLFVVIR